MTPNMQLFTQFFGDFDPMLLLFILIPVILLGMLLAYFFLVIKDQMDEGEKFKEKYKRFEEERKKRLD